MKQDIPDLTVEFSEVMSRIACVQEILLLSKENDLREGMLDAAAVVLGDAMSGLEAIEAGLYKPTETVGLKGGDE